MSTSIILLDQNFNAKDVDIMVFKTSDLLYTPAAVWGGGGAVDDMVQKCDCVGLSRYLAKHYDRYLDAQRDIGHGAIARIRLLLSRLFCVCSRRYGNYLNVFYIFTKFLYLINVYGQLFLLGHWLGDGYQTYGLTVAKKIIQGQDWTEDGRFARVTLCDFEVRQVGQYSKSLFCDPTLS